MHDPNLFTCFKCKQVKCVCSTTEKSNFLVEQYVKGVLEEETETENRFAALDEPQSPVKRPGSVQDRVRILEYKKEGTGKTGMRRQTTENTKPTKPKPTTTQSKPDQKGKSESVRVNKGETSQGNLPKRRDLKKTPPTIQTRQWKNT